MIISNGVKYQTTVGLEIHAELKTRTKMFCDSLNDSDEKHPNTNICPVCMGHPGTLPVINKEAVKHILRIGLALGGSISHYSRFDRKNYFYPDLPKGYQISQYQHPFVNGGSLELPHGGKIKITRVHLEEDTGRLIHKDDDSLVDFNRAGVPLMEMVTEPVISSANVAREFAEEFQRLLRYLDASGANMEKGQMRVEANISLSKSKGIPWKNRNPRNALGTKVEVKNLNSFKAVEKAIEYEYERQSKILDKGEKVKQETRGWDEVKQRTFSQREKEESHDYRYFPEPDLPPLRVYEDEELNPENFKDGLPELPWQKRTRFEKEYNLNAKDSTMLVADEEIASFFEKAVSELFEWIKDPTLKDTQVRTVDLIKLTHNYITSDLQGLIKEKEVPWTELLLTPENFAELIKMVFAGKISSRVAKDVLREMVEEGGDPSDIVRDKGLEQVSGEDALEEIAKKIINENPQAVADYKKGKENALQFLVGQLMRETKGSANPEVAREVLTKLL